MLTWNSSNMCVCGSVANMYELYARKMLKTGPVNSRREYVMSRIYVQGNADN
jgi:hypothetical protein